ncbi:30S ribosomal protein S20 [Candidatus Gottesmanbacteria bacterium]|nr:30S ribosomal protein S20 [Candidatus Gottesmanbacteria bacterium]
MPIIKSAKKKLRQDKKRAQQNLLVKKRVRDTILSFKRKPTPSLLTKVFSILDISAKKKVFHSNKVARLKSRLSKLLKSKPRVTEKKPKSSPKPKSPRKTKTGV